MISGYDPGADHWGVGMRIWLGLLLVIPLAWGTVAAKPSLPPNLGSGLGELIQLQRTDRKALTTSGRYGQALVDPQGRVLVNVHLNGRVPLAKLKTRLERLGMQVVAQLSNYRYGVISLYMPLDQGIYLAQLRGVKAVHLVPKPRLQVGDTTSQGSGIHKTDALNALGFTGTGITVGALSDTYDRATGDATSALDDVRSGDLPGIENPLGNLEPVVVLQEFASGTDEGRGMMQIIHDLAPGAKLCFATAFSGDVGFANNIRALQSDGRCQADVIVDDVIYLNEPMFSDGLIAQAVDDVAALGSHYFSAAGNAGGWGYQSEFREVSRTDVEQLISTSQENLDLSTVPPELIAGGFHDFDPGSGVAVSQNFTLGQGANSISFQWDDPYDGGAITTDYNFLFFDANGVYQASRSGTENNFATDQPLELLTVGAGSFQVAITKAAGGTAKNLRYVVFPSISFEAEFLEYNAPASFGHSAAKGSGSTAAYFYQNLNVPESFTSPGPVTIAFDRNGTRLATVETRLKPDFAAVDQVNTTFFPPGSLALTDVEDDGFPNFAGTSAAAPHAAGVAAVLLDAAGGALTPEALRIKLQETALPHDLDPSFSQATATVAGATVSLTATGDGGNGSSADPNFFGLTFLGSGSLNSIGVDLAPAGLTFDQSTSGTPFTIGTTSGIEPAQISAVITGAVLTLNFDPGAFSSGARVNFGIDRDLVAGGGGNSADELAGATLNAQTSAGSGSGVFSNNIDQGYEPLAGFGLIDAQATFATLPTGLRPLAVPGLQSIAVGETIAYTLQIRPVNTTVQVSNFSILGLPAGATASFDPPTTGSATTLTVVTAPQTPIGRYTLVVNGTSSLTVPPTLLTLEVLSPTVTDLSTGVTLQAGGLTEVRTLRQQITVTNTGATALAGPLYVALDSLTPGATVAPTVGNNTIQVLENGGLLSSGASTSPVTIDFDNPTPNALSYTPQLVDASLNAVNGSVSATGFTQVTARRQQVRVINTSTSTLTGPLFINIQGLTTGALVSNATAVSGTGTPLVGLTLPTLGPGSETTVLLEFQNPTAAPLTYSLSLVGATP